MSGHFAGVDLDQKLSEASNAPEVSGAQPGATDTAPEVSHGTSEKPETNELDKPDIKSEKPELIDLDKLERFRYKGQELTREEWEKSRLRWEDYSKKTQQVAEARKYSDNFQYDLDKVVENPSLLQEMRKVYPPQYVKIAESILKRLPSTGEKELEAPPSEDAGQSDFSNHKITDLESRLQKAMQQIEELTGWKSGLDQQVQEANLAKVEAQVDKWFDKLGKKYPDADPEIVNAKAVYLSEQLEASGKQFTENDLEKLFKSENERIEARYAEKYRSQIEKQKAVAHKAKEIGSGGGVPSTPSKKPRTIKEATNLMLEDLESGRI